MKVDMESYECPECKADLDHQIVGGVGDWRNAILCKKCHHIERGNSLERIWRLASRQSGVPLQQVREADMTSQEEYETVVLGGEPFDDLPLVTRKARWLARRLASQG